MTDLITRLREAIDEDERVARAAARDGDTWTLMVNDWDDQYSDGIVSEGGYIVNSGNVMVAEGRHIARHDPARVLREVAAKREILELHEHILIGDDRIGCRGCGMDSEWGLRAIELDERQACPTVLALAKGYGIEDTSEQPA